MFIRAGKYKTALVVGTEIYSRLLDWSDRSTCVLFGDGAGAVLITESDQPGIPFESSTCQWHPLQHSFTAWKNLTWRNSRQPICYYGREHSIQVCSKSYGRNCL